MIIYKITNNINGKIYIGQTKKALSQRIAEHIKGNNKYNKTPVHRALNKYGLESFTISVIDEADTKEILNEKEIYWIKTLDCKIPKGYNIADGGNGVVGYKHTKKWKKNQSIRFSGDNNPMKNPEIVKKVKIANTGKKQSKETCDKRSESLSGKPKSKEHAEKISKALIGHTVSEEQREKQRIAMTGRKQSEETLKKKKAALVDGKQSKESNEKRSKTMTGITRSEETLKKMKHPHIMSPEGIASIAASNKRRAEEKKKTKQKQKENK